MNEELTAALAMVSDNTKKEFAEKVEPLQKKYNEIQEAFNDKVSKEQLDALKTEYQTTVKNLAEDLEKLKHVAPQEKGLTFQDEISKGLKDNAEKLKQISTAGSGIVTIKAATNITTANFGAGVIRGYREPEIGKIQYADRFVFDLISVMNGGPGSNPMSWINRVPKEGAPAFTAEGAVKPIMDWTYVEEKALAETIAVYSAISRQALINMPMLNQEINDELLRNLYAELDRFILREGTGVSPSINSIWQYAKAFTAGAHLNLIPKANIYDVLRISIEQIRIGDPGVLYAGFTPNAIVVSESTATSMDLEKDTTGNYVLPPFITAQYNIIKGVKVYPTKYLDDDDFLVGDMKRYLFNIVDGIDVSVGYINDQFIRNQLTIRAELMGNGRIKSQDTYAFVKGNFPTAIAAILKP